MASKYLILPAFAYENPYFATLFPVAIGTVLGLSVQPSKTRKTYGEIQQPPGAPPAWAFGPVWTILYGLMGYASHRAWTIGTSSLNPNTVGLAKQGAALYTVQLGLNFLFMPLFFGGGRVVEGTADILSLLGAVTYLTSTWSKIDKVSAYCLVPYIAWVGYASYLSIGIGVLNDWSLTRKSKKQ